MSARRRYRLRALVAEDAAFARSVYASTREDELAQLDWSDEQKRQFVDMQFNAQSTHYARVYPDAEVSVIETPDAVAVGRLYLHRGRQDLRIVDIALLAEWRGRGIGTDVLLELFDEAVQTGRTVSIHVEIFNPALRLYERMGFQPVETVGIHQLMKWSPDPPREVCHG